MSLEYVKTLAGDGADSPQLEAIYQAMNSRLESILGRLFAYKALDTDLLELRIQEGLLDLGYIVDEATLVRWNRVGAEGMDTEIVEGHHTKFTKGDPLEGYMEDIEDYVNSFDVPPSRTGVVRFL